MATWDELRSYIRVSYKVSEDDGQLMKLLFNVDGIRSQVVLVGRTVTGGGVEFATIASPIGTVGTLALDPVLVELSEYVSGGLVTYGDMYMVRHAVPLDNLDTNEFEVPLHLVLNAADALEAKFVGTDAF